MEFKSYTVKVKTPSQWEEFHNTLLSSSSVSHIPDREVTCSDDKRHSSTRGTYLLTDDEAIDLREHHFVDWIELCPTCNPDEYRKPELDARRFKRNIKVYRDLFGNPPSDPAGSVVFDGNDGLDVQYDSSFALGSNSWTVEAFVKYTALPSTSTITSFNGGNVSIKLNTNGRIQYRAAAIGQTQDQQGSIVLSSGTWYHVALVRNGTTLSGYINGALDFSASEFTASFATVTDPLDIGQNSNASPTQQWTGNISSVRFVNGTALYTSNFTVPTEISNITNTVLLCCNSASSATAESTGKTITTIGDPTASSDNPGFKFSYIPDTLTPSVTGSVDFDGSGDYLLIPNDPSFQFGAEEFTIEFWVNRDSSSSGEVLFAKATDHNSSPTTNEYSLTTTSSGVRFRFSFNGTNFVDRTISQPIYAGEWTHVAIVRQNTEFSLFKIFINGILRDTGSYSSGLSLSPASTPFRIGATDVGTNFNGRISNFRVRKGKALYTESFTPPTEELEATYPGITGSVAFDGSGDYLSVPDNTAFEFGSGDFTIEGWVYRNTTGQSHCIASKWSFSGASQQEFILRIESSNRLRASISNGTGALTYESNQDLLENTWYHVALVKNGTSLKIYIDGSETHNGSFTGTIPSTSNNLLIGSVTGNQAFFNGYISNLRFIKGTALYTSNFTVPTQELGTDYPATTGAVEFDGNDYILTGDNEDFEFGSGDFTIEAWIYLTSLNSFQSIVSKFNGSGASGDGFSFKVWNDNTLNFTSSNGTNYSSPGSLSTLSSNTWYHVAVTREGTTLRFFIDGALDTTTAILGTIVNSPDSVTVGSIATPSQYFNGRISNLRIVKGTALYTSAFTVPTQELTAVTGTSLLCCQSTTSALAEGTNKSLSGGGSPQPSTGSPSVTTPGTASLLCCQSPTDATEEATSKTITVNGDTVPSYVSPGLPTGEQENVSLLCCQSKTSVTEEATDKTITAFGDPGISTESPGLLTGGTDRTYNSPEVIRTNWGVKRVGLATNGDFWTETGDLAPEFTDVGYNMTGKNVDIIIQDSGVLQYHPEFMDAKGQSRVRDIVLDGPLHLDPTSSYLQANTYTKADGRIGIATAAAHNWWNNNTLGYRSVDFDAPATTGSVDFDGTFDYLLYPNPADPSDLQLGSASFTIEGWIYLNSLGSSRGIIGKWGAGGPSDQEFIIRSNSINQIQIDLSNGTTTSSFNTGSTRLEQNTWHHFAVIRNGNALQIYIDGTLATNGGYSGTLPSTSSNLIVSGVSGAGEFWNGYISNLRIVKGTALYTSNFTPPTQELTAITGTSILCCQSKTSATEDATGKAINAVGDVAASTTNPGLTDPETGTKDFGTIAVSSTYTVNRSVGESLDGSSGLTDGHGTACAGLAAGKNAGAAFEANIWNMSGIGEPPSLTISIEQNHDLMKIFHKYKPINPQTGVKNPTIINGSWGYRISFAQNGPVNFNFRGTSGTYSGSVTGTGNDLLGKAMVDGLYVSSANRTVAVDSGSSATETAADELMAEGPIYIASAGNNNQRLGIGATDPDRLNTISTFECNHRDFTHPQGIGFDSANDYHPVICIGAMDDEVETNYEERKANYSNNGPGVDVWSPADSTLAPGLSVDSLTYMRYDDTRFYDRYFNGTSAAAPVTTGVLALYLQSNPRATQRQTKTWLNRYGSKIGSPYRDDDTDDQTTGYWTGSYNMRGAEKRILFNPYYANPTQPQQAQLTTSGVSFGGVSISLQ